MKLLCEIVQDLLPLYEDGLCSEASQTSIEEHLKECQECRELLESMREFSEPDIAEIVASKEEQIVAKSFRKVRRRWGTSLVAMLLILPMLVMSVNQIRGIGICFTNVDDILLAGRYVRALANGDYEKLASYMDYEHEYRQERFHLLNAIENLEKGHTKIQLDDEIWMVKNDFFVEYYMNHPANREEVWKDLIFNLVPQVMIPIDVWDEVMELEPDAFIKETRIVQENSTTITQEYYEKDDIVYICIETKWGTFMVQENSGLQSCERAEEFYAMVPLLPKEIYVEAKDEMAAYIMENYSTLVEKYEQFSKMSLEEFTDFMKPYYINQLKDAMDDGYALTYKGFDECYYSEGSGCWIIGYNLEIFYKEKTYSCTEYFSVAHGKIVNYVGGGWHGNYLDETEDTFSEALSMDYPTWDE